MLPDSSEDGDVEGGDVQADRGRVVDRVIGDTLEILL